MAAPTISLSVELAEARQLIRRGERILRAAGVRDIEAAHDVGVDSVTIRRWHAGTSRPNRASALRYAGLLRELAELNSERAS